MKDSDLRKMARRRVEFREHLYIYVIMNAFLVAINLWWSPGFLWFPFPIFFWGLGLYSHYREVYVGTKDAAVDREYQKLKAAQRSGK